MDKDFSRDIAFNKGDVSKLEQDINRGKSILYRHGIKRLLDLCLIIGSAPLTLPVIATIALLVWMSGGKPFYSQKRIGYAGREFRIWKIRSMVVDADAVLGRFLAENPKMKAEWESKQKLVNDPRITRIGHLIRRTSLDELPQLWNVFIGDMSLVGPRPMMVDQKKLYPGTAYYRLRPGLSGPWQISPRNESDFADRAHFDEDYDQNISLFHDIGIILKTVGVVFKATGR